MRLAVISILLSCVAVAQDYVAGRERVPAPVQEFRGAWSACIYNIDWPSKKGLSAAAQQAELRRMLDMMAQLRMNALIFQVRPHADALYESRYEPWSPWLTGRMGQSPGYDPLAFCIAEAHRRGIEVHAWFNPFRAVPNETMAVSRNHISQKEKGIIKRFKKARWMDPSHPRSRQQALGVMMDVVKRYDVDGIHIDDYFYPYPSVKPDGSPGEIFPDGKTPAQRRAVVDAFVKQMYTLTKQTKPWVRVGISPFGIWRPGHPRTVKASIDSYRHLAADSRKWLAKGWCDYMMPQLYWRIEGDQSFTSLIGWWRQQGSRPVWPGIATSRIKSSEDRGRRAGEILNQINATRRGSKTHAGHCHWSVSALLQNRDGIRDALPQAVYKEAALVPPMPWLSKTPPPEPAVSATLNGNGMRVTWSQVPVAGKYVVQARYGAKWMTVAVTGARQRSMDFTVVPAAVAVRAVDRYGTVSSAKALVKR